MSISRVGWPHDWRSRLIAFLEARERAGFAWGARDCLMMTADAHVAMTGRDFAAAYRGRYRSESGAARMLRRNGCADMRDAARRLLREIALVDATCGTIGLTEQEGRWGMGIFCGPYFYVQSSDGLGILPRSAAALAFEVD
ncbi:DUF6950 family protein [Rhizobium sp. G21]|uniref:DUF6950 family protein n=1 Tax=Rhizobium sp. G21 TaxID=2758439 RepID=UPI001600E5CC|nr:hypothetical protein [Rhizobium sp. G21]MBB1247466.1 hypothetical protein [Rhizobium sp. G21]